MENKTEIIITGTVAINGVNDKNIICKPKNKSFLLNEEIYHSHIHFRLVIGNYDGDVDIDTIISNPQSTYINNEYESNEKDFTETFRKMEI